MTNPRKYLWLAPLCLALFAVGCTGKSSRPDAQVAADVQSKINSDGNVPDKQLSINASNGVVTLSGNVSNDAARKAAASDAAQVEGVRTVVNNRQVTPAVAIQPEKPSPTQPSDTSYAGNSAPARQERPSSRVRNRSRSAEDSRDNYNGEPNNANAKAANTPPATPVPWTSPIRWAQAQKVPSPPPAPAAPQKITVPAGTQLSIRMNEEVSSEKAQVGDIFHGSLAAPVIIDGQTVVPG